MSLRVQELRKRPTAVERGLCGLEDLDYFETEAAVAKRLGSLRHALHKMRNLRP
jgi:hypothetical protein